MAEDVNELGYDAETESASDSVSSFVGDGGTLESKSLLQEQYLLIQRSCSNEAKTKNVYCCANEKTRPWLLRIIFLMVIAFGVVVSYFEVQYSTYSSKMLTMNTGDQVLLPLSTYFNRQVKFYTTLVESDYLKLYVLKSKPNISSRLVNYSSGGKFDMPSWTYQYWGYRLLTGTSLRISICTDLQIQFYIIRGEKKLKKWTQQILYNGYDYHKNIFAKQLCKKIADYTTHVLRVQVPDTYYILFSSSAGWRFYTSVSVLLQFNRTYYNVSDAKYVCALSNKTCSAYLDEASTDIALIETILPNKEEDIHPFHKINVQYQPLPRHQFYIKLFGLTFLIVLILSVIYIVWRTVANRSYSEAEKKPLLSQGYSTTNPADRKWIVVSEVSRDEAVCQVEERENKSILGVELDQSLAIDSINSREFMKYQSEAAHYPYGNEYDNSQQLLDACMSSAGTSAI